MPAPTARYSVQFGRGEGVADPRYLLAEIEVLKVIAEEGGFGTLAYTLEVAAIEARSQVEQAQEPGNKGPT